MVEDHRPSQEQQQPQTTPPPATPPHQIPANGNKRCPEQGRASCREWIRLVLEVVALLALIYYAHKAGIQADAAKEAVEAAVESNRLTRESNEGTLRAWLTVKELRAPAIEPGQPTDFTVMLENSGRSPALYIVTSTNVQSFTWPLPTSFEYGYGPDIGSSVVGPGMSHGVGVRLRAFTAQELAILSDEQSKEVLVLYGIVNYADQFSGNRGTMFCFAYKPWKGPTRRWVDCPHGNFAW